LVGLGSLAFLAVPEMIAFSESCDRVQLT
jgi:hypothetical protein